ncbi:hypothetical protein JHD49_05335 [Sulfurimonas sp. SAG-AH-194-C21]|nr:hypothetical protein [Sulfurimonas sp. SAG-AH-194-C21]MDF1883359.1 hypothetical protein [Sulfurimonas sp. SAG-AH-194-C21]
MFGNLLKKQETVHGKMNASLQELVLKIDKMNLTEMRSFINNKIKDLEVSTDGLNLVLERLTKVDTASKKSYINSDDMDSKKKKAFDLVLTILKNKKINIQSMELMQNFLKVYEEIITNYDKEHKDIYASRFNDAISNGVAMIEVMSNMTNKLHVLSE